MQNKRIKIKNKILKNSDMEINLNQGQIIENAWKMYLENYSKGWSWKDMYHIAEVEAKNEAIRQMWKKQSEEKLQAKQRAENERFAASGMDIHSYTMSGYYANGAYSGD